MFITKPFYSYKTPHTECSYSKNQNTNQSVRYGILEIPELVGIFIKLYSFFI